MAFTSHKTQQFFFISRQPVGFSRIPHKIDNVYLVVQLTIANNASLINTTIRKSIIESERA